MADSQIEWTGKCWNIIGGCTNESSGCINCWSRKLVGTRFRKNPRYEGLTVVRGDGKPHWTGKIALFEDRLEEPMHWRSPQLVFVASQADLFHPGVPFEFIDRVFEVMAACPRHTFQILTKRPERMREYFATVHERVLVPGCGTCTGSASPFCDSVSECDHSVGYCATPWPLRNVWLGTSTENQETFDLRVPHLIQTPATVRWLSIEPLIGPIDMTPPHLRGGNTNVDLWLHDLDWIVLGGESGTGARPMHPDWAREIRDRCINRTDMGRPWPLPLFFKQWGNWAHEDNEGCITDEEWTGKTFDWPDGTMSAYMPKKYAGDILDGKRYQQFPR